MMESDMTQMDTPVVSPEPKKRSTGPLILFLMAAFFMPICMLIYHYVLWYMEQIAIASGSVAALAWSGSAGLAVQAVILTGSVLALWRLTTDTRFKPVYKGWFIAALVAFPALLLRFLGPNNDQLGSILQILICGIAALIAARMQPAKVDWRSGNIALALLLAAFGVGPFIVLGAFGSPTDAILDLLAGVSFGWLAALLMQATTGNRFLDAFGIGQSLPRCLRDWSIARAAWLRAWL
jgi:hypothetical protein